MGWMVKAGKSVRTGFRWRLASFHSHQDMQENRFHYIVGHYLSHGEQPIKAVCQP